MSNLDESPAFPYVRGEWSGMSYRQYLFAQVLAGLASRLESDESKIEHALKLTDAGLVALDKSALEGK